MRRNKSSATCQNMSNDKNKSFNEQFAKQIVYPYKRSFFLVLIQKEKNVGAKIFVLMNV